MSQSVRGERGGERGGERAGERAGDRAGERGGRHSHRANRVVIMAGKLFHQWGEVSVCLQVLNLKSQSDLICDLTFTTILRSQ